MDIEVKRKRKIHENMYPSTWYKLREYTSIKERKSGRTRSKKMESAHRQLKPSRRGFSRGTWSLSEAREMPRERYQKTDEVGKPILMGY